MQAGGFDAVIGNPPYIRVSNIPESIRPHLYDKYQINHRFDIYIVFVQKGYELLGSNGRLGFILPNKFMTSDYGRSLRSYLTSRRAVTSLIDFGDNQVFRGATTYTCLLFLARFESDEVLYKKVSPFDLMSPDADCLQVHVNSSQLTADQWTLAGKAEASLIEKLRTYPSLGKFADVQHGLQTGLDDVFLLSAKSWTRGKIITAISRLEELPIQIEKEMLRQVTKVSWFSVNWNFRVGPLANK